ncbi:Calcium-dependent secretion activator 1 [Armadillidium nasatum]|uniref:Calcium-dependent secretion activator 1 n=1 Tax=Armadillidium nasatum TaxID=96803 RepID=A0A5N5TP78_9CRUS|nr:Calcium-dependent secretion activator 1 [Armadillidium nasatum]
MRYEKQEREEEERKRKLQMYVFILRCISYPFNAKQPTDMTRRPIKVTKQQLETIQGRFQSFLRGELQIAADEAFTNAVQSYFDVFLKSERVAAMVSSGACSQNDLRDVFRNNVQKRVRLHLILIELGTWLEIKEIDELDIPYPISNCFAYQMLLLTVMQLWKY